MIFHKEAFEKYILEIWPPPVRMNTKIDFHVNLGFLSIIVQQILFYIEDAFMLACSNFSSQLLKKGSSYCIINVQGFPNHQASFPNLWSSMNSFWLYFRFCKEHDDEELWDMLVDYAVHKPTLIYQLLTSIGTHVHPKILIEKIELGLEIPHLKKALAIIMQDYRLQVTLQVHTVHFF